MKPLPDWSIQALAEGHGTEARLAQMLLTARAETSQLNDMVVLGGKLNRSLSEITIELQVQLKRAREELMGLAGEMKEQQIKNLAIGVGERQ